MLESKLWASENRSLIERRRCKAASKIKKGMIEHQGLEAKDIAVNYRKFSVRTRQGNGFFFSSRLFAAIRSQGAVLLVSFQALGLFLYWPVSRCAKSKR